jgi:xylulose-5-phosphate/fructose-6-phosphate phosphoketolase
MSVLSEAGSGPGDEELRRIDAWWRAACYLAAGMIYLVDNPLLRKPLEPGDIKRRLLGHWGSSPGLAFMYAHLNRVIVAHDLDAIFVAGPGHGAPGVLAPAWLEGTYDEYYPQRGFGLDGMRRFFRDFSFPGGIGSHCTPATPGSIHEGGELGYSLSHGFGAAFDNPDLLVAVAVGDGEAETGPLATAWHSNKFLNPARDGAVLPILHLNGYKIDNPAVLARLPHDELDALLRGYGWTPHWVEGSDPMPMHRAMATTLDRCVDEIRGIQRQARATEQADLPRPQWPMIVLRSPKGWTGPAEVDGHTVEGTWRAHQVPLSGVADDPSRLAQLERWLRSYRPEQLFDDAGHPVTALRELAPRGARRMSANPHANAGLLRRPLRMPEFRSFAVRVESPGQVRVGNTRPLGELLRDVLRLNPDNFRLFGPDETTSNRLGAVYEATGKTWMAQMLETDLDGGHLARDGRVMEMLSEHTVQGWLEGYLLTGRHGLFSTYEAFAHVVDSMFNQHAKWLEEASRTPWRAPIASLNYLITSTVWRQDHNGFTHQDPGFIDLVANKSPNVTRIWLPPDANSLLAVADRCLRGTNRINVVVCDKQQHLQYLDVDAAVRHVTKGAGIWHWASSDEGQEPDVVLACCGDVATQEALAAVALLRQSLPDLRIRFVNVVDLFTMTPRSEHPHGLTDRDFDTLFTRDRPIIFNFHGYPWLIHRLSYRRTNHANLHVRGYKERGSISTPLELAIANEVDRFSLAIDVIDRVPRLATVGAHLKDRLRDQQLDCLAHAHRTGVDRSDINDWQWKGSA